MFNNKKILLSVVLASLVFILVSACAIAVPAADLQTHAQFATATPESELIPVRYIPEPEPISVFDLQTKLTDVYQQANPAVVYIITSLGSGSGFVFDLEGHIVTNNHVVADGRTYEVVFANGERQPAVVTGTDIDSDLAVLQVDELPDDVRPLALADFDSLLVGQIVVAIGNPFGEQGSMSMGIISGVGRSIPSQRANSFQSGYSLPEVIQTDAPINPGNSGGPLLNLDGEVIGVNSAIASETGTNSGVGFSIPVSALQKIIPSLIADGEYTYSYMGVGFDNEISLSEQSTYGVSQIQGAYAVNVEPGSPADRAGLIAADIETGQGGDLITAIDGQLVTNFSDLNSYLVFHTSPGQTINMTVLRKGEQINLPLTLGVRP